MTTSFAVFRHVNKLTFKLKPLTKNPKNTLNLPQLKLKKITSQVTVEEPRLLSQCEQSDQNSKNMR